MKTLDHTTTKRPSEIRREMMQRSETDIREHWFKEHEAELLPLSKGFSWRKPGTGIYGTDILFHRHYVIFCGDMGEAVFSLTWVPTLEYIPNIDLMYFLEKMSAFDGVDLWESTIARASVDLAARGNPEEGNGWLKRDDVHWLEGSVDDRDEFHRQLMRLSGDYDTDDLSGLWECGKVIHPRKQAYLIAWTLAAERMNPYLQPSIKIK